MSKTETIRSPFDGKVVGEVTLSSAEDVDRAIARVSHAFAEMRVWPTHRRASLLERLALRMESERDPIARLMALESGKPIRFCRGEVDRAAVTFRLGAGACRDYGGEVLPADLEARGEGRLCLYRRVPRGPVAAISPFNFPLNLVAHKLSPAFAVGASVLLKPPPQAPLTAFRLAEIVYEEGKALGLPDGALELVHCEPGVAQRMVEDPRMKVLSFTGSDAVGWKLKSLAGKKQVLLELGGNAPCVIDEGVDLGKILPDVVMSAWANAGQVCVKSQRVFVHQSLFAKFMAEFEARTRALQWGDPLDERTIIGPLIERKHVERVLEWIDDAVARGARLVCGGRAEGQVVLPTLLTGVVDDAKVCTEEVFAPVTVVESFSSFEEAIELCNRGRFGLQAGVYTPSLRHALLAYERLEYGGVIINDTPSFRMDNFPYGGTKDSGFGREGVRFAMDEMTEPKTLVLR